MNFREVIAAIPFNPTGDTATGLVAPIMRATGHILYVIGAFAEPDYVLSDEEVQRELTDANAHLSGTTATAQDAPISAAIRAQIINFVNAVHYAAEEYPEWPTEERGPNLASLANAATALGTLFDAELAGVTDSNPGRSL